MIFIKRFRELTKKGKLLAILFLPFGLLAGLLELFVTASYESSKCWKYIWTGSFY